MFAAEDSFTVAGEFRKLFQYGRQQAPHENRDTIAAVIFIAAAIIVAINVELHRFELAFWIGSGVAAVAWICSYHRLLPLVALSGFVALRLTFAFVIEQRLSDLGIALGFAGVTVFLLRLQRK